MEWIGWRWWCRLALCSVVFGTACQRADDERATASTGDDDTSGSSASTTWMTPDSSTGDSTATDADTDGEATTAGASSTDGGPAACHDRQCSWSCKLAPAPDDATGLGLGGPELCRGSSFEALTCVTEAPCASFDASGDPLCDLDVDPLAIDDLAAYQCVFAGLRDRTPGVYSWTICAGTAETSEHWVQVLADGSVIAQREYFAGGDCGFAETRRTLAEPADLDACVMTTDPVTQVACLSSYALECLPQSDSCE